METKTSAASAYYPSEHLIGQCEYELRRTSKSLLETFSACGIVTAADYAVYTDLSCDAETQRVLAWLKGLSDDRPRYICEDPRTLYEPHAHEED